MTQNTEDFDAGPSVEPVAPRRKPRIALMGEFSAGKSTLTNIMIGRPALPTRVTATQLPPVWIEEGDAEPWREDLDGNPHPLDADRLEGVPVSETAFLHLYMKAEVLEVCDLIDTPGISDPNMAPEVWQRAADEADGVIWLTHATQAWRQSEAAVWDQMPGSLRSRSLLLVTRFDKLLTESDRGRVLHRVRRETEGKFRAVLPISLTAALAAGDDSGKWTASGGEAFSDALLEIISEIERRLRIDGDPRAPRMPAASLRNPAPAPAPAPDAAQSPPSAPAEEPVGLKSADAGSRSLRAALAPEPVQHTAQVLRMVPGGADISAETRMSSPRRVVPASGAAVRPLRPRD